MVKPTKGKSKKKQPNVKVVTYNYADGLSCTVVTPADPIPTEQTIAPPAGAMNLITTSMKNNAKNSTISTNSVAATATTSPTASTKPRTYSDLRAGVKKQEAMDIVHGYSFPDRPFTIKEVLLGTGINHWYVSTYIKTNAKVVGNAPKQPGERGKVAKLYQLEKRA